MAQGFGFMQKHKNALIKLRFHKLLKVNHLFPLSKKQ